MKSKIAKLEFRISSFDGVTLRGPLGLHLQLSNEIPVRFWKIETAEFFRCEPPQCHRAGGDGIASGDPAFEEMKVDRALRILMYAGHG